VILSNLLFVFIYLAILIYVFIDFNIYICQQLFQTHLITGVSDII